MEPVNNNQFEIKLTTKSKRKIATTCPNVYLNPALDLLANEDPMCNTAMEVLPNKKRKRTRSCEIVTFENSALDLGISKAAVNEFLVRELENVKKTLRAYGTVPESKAKENNLQLCDPNEPAPKILNDAHKDIDMTFDVDISLNFDDTNPHQNMLRESNVAVIHPSVSQPLPAVLPTFERKQHNPSTVDAFEEIEEPTLMNDDSMMIPESMAVEEQSLVDEPKILLKETEIATVYPMNETYKPKLPDRNPRPTTVNTPTVSTEPIYSNLTEVNSSEETIGKEEMVVNIFNNSVENIPTLPISGTVLNETADLQNTEISVIDFINAEPNTSATQNKSTTTNGDEFGNINLSSINNITNIQANITNQIFINNTSNINLSFIERLGLNSPNLSNQSLFYDDTLNESNIMEIKTITMITNKTEDSEIRNNTNPFLVPTLNNDTVVTSVNPFTNTDLSEMEYSEEVMNRPVQIQIPQVGNIMPKRLFTGDSTVSTVNESCNTEQHEYENVDSYRSESPIYENVCEENVYENLNFSKQSKILGHDVSQFHEMDILNLYRNRVENSNESNDSKKDRKHQMSKMTKLSKKVLKNLKKRFNKSEKPQFEATLNPYEVPRKSVKPKVVAKEAGIENPALNIDVSDEMEEDEDEHQYESIKTLRNTRLNMNVTPLKERHDDNIDISHNKSNTPSKKVRFDSTLNQEKVITGNSFDYGIQSPGFDGKIDKYQDELENCMNEKKFIQQHM